MGLIGVPATTNAIRAVAELGADISKHLSSGLNEENIRRAMYRGTLRGKKIGTVQRGYWITTAAELTKYMAYGAKRNRRQHGGNGRLQRMR